MNWPQYVTIFFWIFCFGWTVAKHGKPRTGTIDLWWMLIMLAVYYYVLACGGFFPKFWL